MNGAKLQSIKAHENWVSSVNFSKDDKLLVSGGGDSIVKVWDVLTGK